MRERGTNMPPETRNGAHDNSDKKRTTPKLKSRGLPKMRPSPAAVVTTTSASATRVEGKTVTSLTAAASLSHIKVTAAARQQKLREEDEMLLAMAAIYDDKRMTERGYDAWVQSTNTARHSKSIMYRSGCHQELSAQRRALTHWRRKVDSTGTAGTEPHCPTLGDRLRESMARGCWYHRHLSLAVAMQNLAVRAGQQQQGRSRDAISAFFFGHRRLHRAVKTWRAWNRGRIDCKGLCHRGAHHYNQHLQRRLFRHWHQAWADRRIAADMDFAMDIYHEGKLCRAVLLAWKAAARRSNEEDGVFQMKMHRDQERPDEDVAGRSLSRREALSRWKAWSDDMRRGEEAITRFGNCYDDSGVAGVWAQWRGAMRIDSVPQAWLGRSGMTSPSIRTERLCPKDLKRALRRFNRWARLRKMERLSMETATLARRSEPPPPMNLHLQVTDVGWRHVNGRNGHMTPTHSSTEETVSEEALPPQESDVGKVVNEREPVKVAEASMKDADKEQSEAVPPEEASAPPQQQEKKQEDEATVMVSQREVEWEIASPAPRDTESEARDTPAEVPKEGVKEQQEVGQKAVEEAPAVVASKEAVVASKEVNKQAVESKKEVSGRDKGKKSKRKDKIADEGTELGKTSNPPAKVAVENEVAPRRERKAKGGKEAPGQLAGDAPTATTAPAAAPKTKERQEGRVQQKGQEGSNKVNNGGRPVEMKHQQQGAGGSRAVSVGDKKKKGDDDVLIVFDVSMGEQESHRVEYRKGQDFSLVIKRFCEENNLIEDYAPRLEAYLRARAPPGVFPPKARQSAVKGQPQQQQPASARRQPSATPQQQQQQLALKPAAAPKAEWSQQQEVNPRYTATKDYQRNGGAGSGMRPQQQQQQQIMKPLGGAAINRGRSQDRRDVRQTAHEQQPGGNGGKDTSRNRGDHGSCGPPTNKVPSTVKQFLVQVEAPKELQVQMEKEGFVRMDSLLELARDKKDFKEQLSSWGLKSGQIYDLLAKLRPLLAAGGR